MRTIVQLIAFFGVALALALVLLAKAPAWVVVLGMAAVLFAFVIVAFVIPLRALAREAHAIRDELDTEANGTRPRSEVGTVQAALVEMRRELSTAQADVHAERRVRAIMQQSLRRADRMSTLQRVAGALGHSLGTPLAVVLGRAQLLLATPVDDPAITRSAQAILRAAESMDGVMQRLVESAEGSFLRMNTVPVSHVFEQVLELVEPVAEMHDTTIDVGPIAAEALHADPNRVVQVLTNVLTRAAEVTPDGGTVRVHTSTVDISAPPEPEAEPGRFVRIEVEDGGTLQAREDLLFDPFAADPDGRDTLDLVVSHRVMVLHGGFVDIHPIDEGGTCVALHFPMPPLQDDARTDAS